MPKREFQEKSVKKAVARACRELNLKTANLEYKIISHGSSGIFGLVGSRKAKILVTLPATDNGPNDPETVDPIEVRSAEVTPEDTTEAQTPIEPKPVFDSKTNPDGALSLENDEPNDIGETVEFGRTFLQHLVDVITSDTTITSTVKNRKIAYDVAGGNSALLIGKHGQTLEALQFLTERAMNRTRDQRFLVEVDVAEYQAKRKETLIDQAKRMADKATHNRRPVTIGPLSPQDRRVVHMTLKSNTLVRTQSNGKGVVRKLTIYPKKRNKRTPRKR